MAERRILHNYDEYLEQLETEKEWFKKYNLIKTGKLPSEPININNLPPMSQKVIGYGFNIKLINMFSVLDTLNVNLVSAYEYWEADGNQDIMLYNQWIFTYTYCLNSYIIHDMKHFVDDILAVCWVLRQPKIVENVEVASVGTYLKRYNAGNHTFKDFDNFVEFFTLINDIENAYKHHIPNNMTMIKGRDEACIYAFYSPQNKSFLHPQLKGVSLSNLVDQFNEFYKFSFEVIEKYQ